MTKTNKERDRKITCCVKLMSGRAEGVLGPGITSCWNQEWSLTDGFRDSNALSPSRSHAQIINAIFATILVMDMIIMISTMIIINDDRCQQQRIGRVDSLCQISTSDMWRWGWTETSGPAPMCSWWSLWQVGWRQGQTFWLGSRDSRPRLHFFI